MFFIVSGFMIYVSTVRHRNADGSFQTSEICRSANTQNLSSADCGNCHHYSGLPDNPTSGSTWPGELSAWRRIIRCPNERRSNGRRFPAHSYLLYGAVRGLRRPLIWTGRSGPLSYEWWFYILIFLSARFWNGWSFSTLLPLAAVGVMLLYGRNALFLWFFLIWLSGFCLGHIYVKGQLFVDKFWPRVAALAVGALIMMFVMGRGHLVSDLLNPFDTPSLHKDDGDYGRLSYARGVDPDTLGDFFRSTDTPGNQRIGTIFLYTLCHPLSSTSAEFQLAASFAS